MTKITEEYNPESTQGREILRVQSQDEDSSARRQSRSDSVVTREGGKMRRTMKTEAGAERLFKEPAWEALNLQKL